MGEVGREPFGVARIGVGERGALCVDFAAQVGTGDRNLQVRAGMVVHGNGCSRLQLELGRANSVFDEEYLLGSVGEKVVLLLVSVLLRGQFSESFILQNFNGDISEWIVRGVAHELAEGGRREPPVAIGELYRGWRL